MDMPAVFVETIEAFELMPDRRSRLEHLISIGETLERDPSIETEQNRVPGCVSNVFLTGACENDRMRYRGWADALIVRGFVKLLCDAFNGVAPREMVDGSPMIVDEFVQKSGIDVSMIESRANTFATLATKMRSIAEEHA